MYLLIDNKKIIELDIAKNFYLKFKGLMGKKNISRGLYFPNCNSIHMFFMKESIDVLYLNNKGIIISMDKGLKPWSVGKIRFAGKSLIELPYGTIDKYNIALKQKVTILSDN